MRQERLLVFYQAITGPEERQKLFREFSPGFFDLFCKSLLAGKEICVPAHPDPLVDFIHRLIFIIGELKPLLF